MHIHAHTHRYDVNDDKWTLAPPLQTSRSAPGAAVLNGCIYAVGTYLLN